MRIPADIALRPHIAQRVRYILKFNTVTSLQDLQNALNVRFFNLFSVAIITQKGGALSVKESAPPV